MVAQMNHSNNHITLGAFVGIIKAILDFSDMQHQFAVDMDKYLDGSFITEFGSPFVSAVIDGLERCFAHGDPNDEYVNGIISWWLWDAPDAGKSLDSACIGSNRVDGMWYSLSTPELLYEYLTTGETRELTSPPVDPQHNPNFGK